MPDLREKLERSREAILIGEIGGFLHMFGKASAAFLRANSLGGTGKDGHQSAENFGDLWPLLQDARLADRFVLGNERLADKFSDFIAKYEREKADSHLLRLFNSCHGITSADEKGVVRRPQPIDSMSIRSPFGRCVMTLAVDQIDRLRGEMLATSIPIFEDFLSNKISVEELRTRLVSVLQPGMSQTLGETREPANDVTLWTQSFGVASLFKSTLATVVLGHDPCTSKNGKPDYDSVKWRLFGIGWNGAEFTGRGRKPADILERHRILSEIRKQLSVMLELEAPVGNLFYADLNGVFFTFPGVDSVLSSELIREIGPDLIQIVRQESSNELWPFLTLSEPRRTLTAIARQIAQRERTGGAPCASASLALEDDGSEVLIATGPTLSSESKHDVCPACRVRSKKPAEDICKVCGDRRSGRQAGWLDKAGGETIWVDEIADEGNQLALLTLRFNLEPWLNGSQFGSIFTQTLDEWKQGNRFAKAKRDLQQYVSKGELDPDDPLSLAEWITKNQQKPQCQTALQSFMEERGGKIPNTAGFFRELKDAQGTDNANAILSHFFTQNPSPGRLSRVLEATDDFVGALNRSLTEDFFAKRPRRISFITSSSLTGVRTARTYRLTVVRFQSPIVVLAANKQQFLTVDNLDKFGGSEAFQRALKEEGVKEWRDEDTGELIHGATAIDRVSAETPYLPFTTISRSPVLSQFLLPAKRMPDILRILLDLEADHFGPVAGKLALHVGVVVAKRKFPLYALLEAGRKIVNHQSLDRGSLQTAWFDTASSSDFYKLYPTGAPGSSDHVFSKLAAVEEARQYWLTPGYFDFDYLRGTVDTQRLRYSDAGRREAINYGWLRPRPIPLFRLKDVLKIQALLTGIGNTQRHELGSALATRLEQWRAVGERAIPVYARFAKAVLQDAFTGKGWNALTAEEQDLLQHSAEDGLLLEAIEFFDHVIKGEATKQ